MVTTNGQTITQGTDMLALIRRHRTFPVAEHKTLHAGDFCFVGQGPDGDQILIGIERKRMRDMVNSIRGGRLSGEQIPKLLSYDRAYIILESRWKTDWATGQLMERHRSQWRPVMSGTKQIMTGLELESYLNDIRDKTPIQVIKTEHEYQTVEVVMALAHSWSKPWPKRHHHSDIHRPPKYAQVEKASTLRRVLYALDKVGWERSGAAEEVFSTVEQLVGASTKDLEKIPGFGRKIAGSVYEQLHGATGGGE
jgi:ERCC4-type nuclease